MTTRTFTDTLATRKQVPLLIGLVGPSGGGKTFSALRLGAGIQRVTGGDIGFIDTEANRSLHYADKFKFQHLPFGAPFGPLDYLQAIEHFAKKGVKTIIIDSMSHEHEGPGGVLEMHDAEVERMSGGDDRKREANNFRAWSKPKAERRRLINSILQMNLNFICCFRAKEKLKMQRVDGRNAPVQQGWQPIAGEEFVFEMTLNCLLMPGANGVPSWNPEEKAERQMIKLPQQFRDMFKEGVVLSEELGVKLAEWSKGGSAATAAAPAAQAPAPAQSDELATRLKNRIDASKTMDELGTIWAEFNKAKAAGQIPTELLPIISKAKDDAKARIQAPTPAAAGELL